MAKKKKTSASADVEKTAAAKRAEIIRQTIPAGSKETPGGVIGGHVGWHYVILPFDLDVTQKHRMERKLEMRGFELETDQEVVVSGHYKPTLWKIPKEIHDEQRALVKAGSQKTAKQARRSNIL